MSPLERFKRHSHNGEVRPIANTRAELIRTIASCIMVCFGAANVIMTAFIFMKVYE